MCSEGGIKTNEIWMQICPLATIKLRVNRVSLLFRYAHTDSSFPTSPHLVLLCPSTGSSDSLSISLLAALTLSHSCPLVGFILDSLISGKPTNENEKEREKEKDRKRDR